MIVFFNHLWQILGEPSFVSGGTALIVALLVKKVFGAVTKDDLEEELKNRLELINYRLDQLEKKR